MPVATPPAPASAAAPPGAVAAPGTCKLCLVGMPGVGKTSLAQRLLHGRFPAAPASPGITVATHRWSGQGGATLAATLWDVAGNSAIDTLNQAFLSRVDGIAAVAAPDQPQSVARALQLVEQIRLLYPGTPAALLFNKTDLAAPPAARPALPADVAWHDVSARDDRGVAAAFAELAARARKRREAAGSGRTGSE
jgi:small GTP-binding protein